MIIRIVKGVSLKVYWHPLPNKEMADAKTIRIVLFQEETDSLHQGVYQYFRKVELIHQIQLAQCIFVDQLLDCVIVYLHTHKFISRLALIG